MTAGHAPSGKFINGGSAAAKLTFEQVQEIRQHLVEGATQSALCKYYGVSIGTIGRIARGESWKAGAAAGRGSQAEIDASQRKLFGLLGINAIEELAGRPTETYKPPETKPELPLLSARAGAYGAEHAEQAHVSPPSLLDGGDAAASTDGTGLEKLKEKAGDLPEAIDGLLNKES